MSRSPLERYAGELAVANADLGARLALQVSIESLREWGFNEAADSLETGGERAVAAAFATLAWSEPEGEDRTYTPYRWTWPEDEDLPAAGQAGPTKPKSA